MEVCNGVFVSWCLLIIQPTWLLFMTDWVLSCASGQDRSELVLNGPAAEVSTCCSKPSSSFHFSVLSSETAQSSFLFSSHSAWLQAQHVFSLSRPPGHLSFCLFHFHFQHSAHTLIQTDQQNTCKSAGWPKSEEHLTQRVPKLVSNKSDLSSFTEQYNFIQTYLTPGWIHLGLHVITFRTYAQWRDKG